MVSKQLYLALCIKMRLQAAHFQIKLDNNGETPSWYVRRILFLNRVIRKEESKAFGW